MEHESTSVSLIDSKGVRNAAVSSILNWIEMEQLLVSATVAVDTAVEFQPTTLEFQLGMKSVHTSFIPSDPGEKSLLGHFSWSMGGSLVWA